MDASPNPEPEEPDAESADGQNDVEPADDEYEPL